MATDKTVLDFTEITDSEDADILYAIRGTDDTRDKKTTKASFLAPDRLKGIATYDAAFEYLADNSIVQHDNLIWRSIYGTTGTPNVGNTPGIANLDKWELVSVFAVPLTVSATGAITQTVTDLFITSNTASGDNAITIPDGVRAGQKFNVLSLGNNITNIVGSNVPSGIVLNNNGYVVLIWNGLEWIYNVNSPIDVDIIKADNLFFRSQYFKSPTTISEIGTGLNLSLAGFARMTALSSTDVAIVDFVDDEIKLYRRDITTNTWSQVGTGLSVNTGGDTAIGALNSTDVAYIDNSSKTLRTYRWNEGTGTWSQVGTALTLAFYNGILSLAALNSTDICAASSETSQYRLSFCRWNEGTGTWSQVGTEYTSTIIRYPSLAALNSTDVVLFETDSESLRTYRWNEGTGTWSQVGTALTLAAGFTAVIALNSTDILVCNQGDLEFGIYRWTGEKFIVIGNKTATGTITQPTMTSLSPTDFLFHDATNQELKTYRLSFTDYPPNPAFGTL